MSLNTPNMFTSIGKYIDKLLRIDKFKKSRASKFKQDAFKLFCDTFKKTENGDNELLTKELIYLIYYTFKVLEDDFNKGDNILQQNITNIDDYVFSKYKKKKNLKYSIDKLIVLSFSERFFNNPKKNLLSYYVFIEENGFEIIMLFQDYYEFLIKNQSLFLLTNIKKYANEKKKVNVEIFDTTNITKQISPIVAQKIIYDAIEKK